MRATVSRAPILTPEPGIGPPPEPAPPPSPTRSPRVLFVDVLRLIAAIQMINGHTLDAILVDGLRQGRFFEIYTMGRGLVSVSFLLVAGIAFHLSTLARYEKHRSSAIEVRRRFRIGLVLIGIGYLLGFPWSGWHSNPEVADRAWYYFHRIGVLHCIGMGIVLLEIITVLSPRRRYVVVASAVLATFFIFLAPWGDSLIRDGRYDALLSWMSHQGGSQFPLFPWIGFIFAGVLVGAYLLPGAGRTPFRTVAVRMGVVCTLCVALWAALELAPWSAFDRALHHPSTNPRLSAHKLAMVCIILALLAFLCRNLPRLPWLLAILAGETLTIFVFHLLVLYWPTGGLARAVGRSLELPAALGVAAGMIVLTCAYTVFWNRVKARLGGRSRREAAAPPATGSPPTRAE